MKKTMIEMLPETFKARMQASMGEEYESFLESYNERPYAGLRINRLKLNTDDYASLSGEHLEPVPWCPDGLYYDGSKAYSKNPLYHAGLYYIQEPSAMFPAQTLPVEAGDRVLDMCAAPGGKSTALAAKLGGSGVLVSNDISASRAKALLKNIEASGVRNAVVLTEDPVKLAPAFTEWFDKILIDAPCSGEGMFRKEPSMMKAWERSGPDFFSKLQKQIVDCGVKMLAPGGMMLYSTCTFSPEENEGTLQYILDNWPEMHVVEILDPGEGPVPAEPALADAAPETANAKRLWPHKLHGEGHFTALLRKDGEHIKSKAFVSTKGLKEVPEEFAAFLKDAGITLTFDPARMVLQGDHLSYVPEDMPVIKGFRCMRTGWYLGDIKKKRFEPSGSFARALTPEECTHFIKLSADDPRAVKYLKCETLEIDEELKNGWYIVGVDRYALGWGKLGNGTLKNKYPSGWRWM